MRNKENIDWLLETKAKNDKAIAEYVSSLREKLRRLEGAGSLQTADSRRQQSIGNLFSAVVCRLRSAVSSRRLRSVVCRLPSAAVCRLLTVVLLGVAIGVCVHLPFFVAPNKPPIVQPETESLEDFVAREAERLLTTEERTKLIAVAEMILGQHFVRASAIEEEFRFQRRLAGINSPAFNAFADKWAAKVEEMHLEDSIEAMQKVYRSLLQGLHASQKEAEDSGQEEEHGSREVLESAILTPDSLLHPTRPATQRQRFFK